MKGCAVSSYHLIFQQCNLCTRNLAARRLIKILSLSIGIVVNTASWLYAMKVAQRKSEWLNLNDSPIFFSWNITLFFERFAFPVALFLIICSPYLRLQVTEYGYWYVFLSLKVDSWAQQKHHLDSQDSLAHRRCVSSLLSSTAITTETALRRSESCVILWELVIPPDKPGQIL